jgi:glycosyltransferase Alg8
MAILLYTLALLAIAVHAPESLWHPAAPEFLLIVGAVGVWRYGWGAVHVVRSLIYRRMVFPKWRRRADLLATQLAVDNAGDVERASLLPQVFFVITSYRIRGEITAAVYRAAIREAERWPGLVTIIASLVEPADERLVRLTVRQLQPAKTIRLVFVTLPARGKREALAAGLRAVARRMPRSDDIVVVMDGDAVLAPDTLRRCAPFFDLFPRLGGLTTDEDALVQNGVLLREWHALRFAQRHLLMSSVGLSRRVLVMTGRMSMFRAGIATRPDFIRIVEEDGIWHWRLGRLRFLTGEDKSTWYWLLEHGYDMLYVPDVQVTTIEDPPDRRFMVATTQLMLRWFGNMLRGSGRAIELGPRRVGPFLWWCLIDQRLSMWTPLVGPLAAVCLAMAVSPTFLVTYVPWVMITRLLLALGLLSVRPRIGGFWPILLYYNQVYGALVKTFILFRLDRQRWTRQNISLPAASLAETWRRISSAFLHGLALACLATAVAFATGLLAWPQRFVFDLGS